MHEVLTLVQLEELSLERREPEEPVPLLDPLRLAVVLGALAVDEVCLGLERLATDAVEPGVDVLVDVPVVVEPLQEALDELLVLLVARADEEVVRGIESLWELTPDARDLVGVLLRDKPCSAATRATFAACSSTPVRKNVSSPRWRRCRTRMSAAIVVYAWPMCGVELT